MWQVLQFKIWKQVETRWFLSFCSFLKPESMYQTYFGPSPFSIPINILDLPSI